MPRPETPFHPRSAQANLTPWWYGWNGYLVPDVYTDPLAELNAIRTAAAAIDMTPLPKYAVSGPEAPAYLDWLITREAGRLPVGGLLYTPLCDQEGALVADGVVMRLDETVYRLTLDNCLQWLRLQAAGFDVQIEDITGDYGLLALQGPGSRTVLASASGQAWEDLAFMRCRATKINGVRIIVARTGFTGELGYELWVQAAGAASLWDALFQAGESHGLLPAGEYAIDMARVEAGLVVITADYTGSGPDTRSAEVPLLEARPATPYELGLGRFIDLNKPDFCGRAALLDEQARGPARQLVGLEHDWAGVVELYTARGLPPEVAPRVRWDALPILADGDQVGWATSITWSPTIGRLIGFGRVPAGMAAPGTTFTVRWPVRDDSGTAIARAVDLPFVRPRRA